MKKRVNADFKFFVYKQTGITSLKKFAKKLGYTGTTGAFFKFINMQYIPDNIQYKKRAEAWAKALKISVKEFERRSLENDWK